MRNWEQIARETVRAWHAATPKIHGELASLADHIATALRNAYSAGCEEGRAEGMREAAGIAENEGVRPETNVYAEFLTHNRRIRDAIISAIGGQK